MIIDPYGLPQDFGATDSMDSARLAGMMALVGHAQCPDLRKYVVHGFGVRHPFYYPSNNHWNFTRDQLMPLAAGLFFQDHINEGSRDLYFTVKNRGWMAQNEEKDFPGSKKKFPDGPDWISFSHRLVLAKCAKTKIPLLLAIIGYCWLLIDILFNALFTPKRESNQLLCCLVVMGPFWVKLYKKMTPSWKLAIINYWSGWRAEKDLAQMLINKIELY